VRLRSAHENHVWSYDFISARTHDGRSVRILNLIDEYTRESLLIRAERRWSSAKVISALADVMVWKGVPEHLRSDNGPEFVAKDLRKWLADTGAKTLYLEPGSPWENGYCESFNSKLRDEFLNGEIFYSIKELRVLAERWRVHYNTVRPHSSLGYKPPAPEAWLISQERGMEKWKPLRASHFSTPPTATIRTQDKRATLTPHWYKTSGNPQIPSGSSTATEAVSRIGALYDIEREVRGKLAAVRTEIRQARARPLLDELHRWLNKTLAGLSPKSDTALAIR
jgi:hypothetical protein